MLICFYFNYLHYVWNKLTVKVKNYLRIKNGIDIFWKVYMSTNICVYLICQWHYTKFSDKIKG